VTGFDTGTLTGHAPQVLLVVAAPVGLWLLLVVVRYVRADRGTRVSMRQAVRVRWSWVRLARMAGLTVTDKTPGLLAQITAQKDGAAPAPRVLTPRIKVKPDRFGVVVRAGTLPKVGLEEYQKAARFLAAAWRCTPVSVLPNGPGRVVIRGVRSDPLTTPTEHRPTGRPPEDVARWELGVDEYAAPVCVSRGGLTTLPTKTRASERRIVLPARCVQSLKLHQQQQREREAAGPAWQHNGHVFTTAQGGAIDPTNLTRAFTTLLRKAGLRRIRFHDLRHSTATLLLEQGVELVVIKELLGHAHIGVTTTVYAHVRLRLQRDAIDTLGTALGSPEST
jgi:S-DNA-T family DNA segregation ATPase FtsK/SpoIIIE